MLADGRTDDEVLVIGYQFLFGYGTLKYRSKNSLFECRLSSTKTGTGTELLKDYECKVYVDNNSIETQKIVCVFLATHFIRHESIQTNL